MAPGTETPGKVVIANPEYMSSTLRRLQTAKLRPEERYTRAPLPPNPSSSDTYIKGNGDIRTEEIKTGFDIPEGEVKVSLYSQECSTAEICYNFGVGKVSNLKPLGPELRNEESNLKPLGPESRNEESLVGIT